VEETVTGSSYVSGRCDTVGSEEKCGGKWSLCEPNSRRSANRAVSEFYCRKRLDTIGH
jgi:hypothetical protein